ncbi:MAG: hypothetical protein OEY01_09170 [Desulfobulbaceae bacterium]|nr:hypothetical protein [Desulfobulbaceae bacterium]HIJ79173.1 hypothetical protein [Deltaproteobacteria bacterium]
MQFESFEQALHVCMTAEQGTDEHEAALIYCLDHAPADLKEKIKEGLADFHKGRQEKHDGGCGCGCNHD